MFDKDIKNDFGSPFDYIILIVGFIAFLAGIYAIWYYLDNIAYLY